jgi:hypothetical protein
MTRAPRCKALAAGIMALSGCSSSQGTGETDAGPLDVGTFDVASSDSDTDSSTDSNAGSDSNSADAGLPPENCNGLAYCDDFEGYDDAGSIKNGAMLGPWKASVGYMVSMTVDGVRAYTGHKALHVMFAPSQGSTGGMLAQSAEGGIIAGGNMFGRAMFYFAAPPGDASAGLPSKVHSEFFLTKGMYDPADAGVLLDIAETDSQLFLNYFPPHHFELAAFGGTVTAGAWHCLQWEIDGAGMPPANQAQVWLDEQPVIDIPPSKGWVWATPWTIFSFGFAVLQPEANAIDISLDTFALDSKMIACP